jgi:hypothetical protein
MDVELENYVPLVIKIVNRKIENLRVIRLIRAFRVEKGVRLKPSRM